MAQGQGNDAPDVKDGDIWAPYKDIHTQVSSMLFRPDPEAATQLEAILRKYRTDFHSLLRYPVKNAAARDEVNRAAMTGNLNNKGPIVASIIEEALLISNMFNLNEYLALDLLCKADSQQSNYPSVARGLVAVLLYYDGRKSIAHSLHLLMQGRKGATWTLGLPPTIQAVCTNFTNQLLDNGIVGHVLGVLEQLDWPAELDILQQNLALGGARHRREVEQLYQGIRMHLAEALFCAASQAGLKKEDTLKLIEYLAKQNVKNGEVLDPPLQTLLLTLLTAIDLSVLQKQEDFDEAVSHLPILTDIDFIPVIHNKLYGTNGSIPAWECEELQAVAHFGWALTLGTLRTSTARILNQENVVLADLDETVLDTAIDHNALEFLCRKVIPSPGFYMEEFHIRRVHQIITDLLVTMPLKVKELRNKADETSRTALMYSHEGLECPPNLPHHFEYLLSTIEHLYKEDKLKLNLSLEYWGPNDNVNQSSHHRQIALFKFVCLAGDLIPSALFEPYLRMVQSLATTPRGARQAFSLLKSNGSSGALSWDHFFASMNRYLSNLRQELPPTSDTVYRRPFAKGITPLEVKGMIAVLQLLKTVADNDDNSRSLLTENLNWSPLSVLIGLVCCSVPTLMKAELVKALSAFSRSPQLAPAVWQSMEAAQLIITVPVLSTTSFTVRDVQVELEEVESRSESYPLTRSVLYLINVLTDSPLPATLGSGKRTPGFGPYLHYITNVLIRCPSRNYKDPGEKWEIAAQCLTILRKLVHNYEPNSDDFAMQKQKGMSTFSLKALLGQPPAFQIMIQMLSESPLLKLVLQILEEGSRLLCDFVLLSGLKEIEKCCLNALEFIVVVLRQQPTFLDMISNIEDGPTVLLLGGIPQLLLSINPRSGKPDHMLHITRFLGFPWLIPHACAATTILLGVSNTPSADHQLLALFNSSRELSIEIRHAVVETMESQEPQDNEILEYDHTKLDSGDIVLSSVYRTKLLLINFIHQCLPHPAPNLAHYLLGFDLNQPIKKSTINNPGVADMPRSAIHSLIQILDLSLTMQGGPTPASILCERAFSLLHALCADIQTSGPVLRYLKSVSFFPKHMAALNLQPPVKEYNLKHASWLLMSLAIELKLAGQTQQHMQLERLVSLLIGTTHDDAEQTNAVLSLTPKSPKLLELLEFLDFGYTHSDDPRWEYFDVGQVKQLLVECQQTIPESNIQLIDISRIHRVLMDEVAALQGNMLGPRQMVVQDIKSILVYAVERNEQNRWDAAREHFLEAWRQITETLILVTTPVVMHYNRKQELVLELLQLLLRKVLQDDSHPHLTTLASSTVLLLTSALRIKNVEDIGMNKANVTLDSRGFMLVNQGSALQVILNGLLSWILKSGVLPQRTRANLYGSVLGFLRLVQAETAQNSSKRDLRLMETSSETVAAFGDRLLEALCRDCTSGHDITKMLTLSCLDALSACEPSRGSLLRFLNRQGSLQHLILTLPQYDGPLLALLSPTPPSLRVLYLYEAKMSFLCHLACVPSGAQCLLQHGLLSRLADMHVFELCASILERRNSTEEHANFSHLFIPPLTQRARDVLLPVLHLCHAILSSLGSDNRSATFQVLQFILRHSESFAIMLHGSIQHLDANILQERALLVGVLSRSATQDLFLSDLEQPEAMDDVARLSRLARLLLLQLPLPLTPQHINGPERYITSVIQDMDKDKRQECCIHLLMAASHTLLFAQRLSRGRISDVETIPISHVLLAPTINERSNEQLSGSGEVPGLGALIVQLKRSVEHVEQTWEYLQSLRRLEQRLPQMSAQEIRELLTSSSSTMSRTVACSLLKKRIDLTLLEGQLAIVTMESTLALLWGHTEKFSEPRPVKDNSEDVWWSLTHDDMVSLKEDLARCLDDVLMKRLQDASKHQFTTISGPPSPPLTEALVRRLCKFFQLPLKKFN